MVARILVHVYPNSSYFSWKLAVMLAERSQLLSGKRKHLKSAPVEPRPSKPSTPGIHCAPPIGKKLFAIITDARSSSSPPQPVVGIKRRLEQDAGAGVPARSLRRRHSGGTLLIAVFEGPNEDKQGCIEEYLAWYGKESTMLEPDDYFAQHAPNHQRTWNQPSVLTKLRMPLGLEEKRGVLITAHADLACYRYLLVLPVLIPNGPWYISTRGATYDRNII
ncbi:hypothetical protein K488DRAFT_72437 [Vararia minispora EC-137]|uniref:Uncharacterized protein n=1 Tax=Vararia minispora EC-137 TaxID=1314806 RepID=A0ACB8QE70_9AGAM|nr:hypothetical protein K488DRAFT_72437 [Vararia minispora EC-137]